MGQVVARAYSTTHASCYLYLYLSQPGLAGTPSRQPHATYQLPFLLARRIGSKLPLPLLARVFFDMYLRIMQDGECFSRLRGSKQGHMIGPLVRRGAPTACRGPFPSPPPNRTRTRHCALPSSLLDLDKVSRRRIYKLYQAIAADCIVYNINLRGRLF